MKVWFESFVVKYCKKAIVVDNSSRKYRTIVAKFKQQNPVWKHSRPHMQHVTKVLF